MICEGLVEALIEQLKCPNDEFECRCLKLEFLGVLTLDSDVRDVLFGGSDTCADVLEIVEHCEKTEDSKDLVAVLGLVGLLSSFQDERSVGFCEMLERHIQADYSVGVAAVKALVG